MFNFYLSFTGALVFEKGSTAYLNALHTLVYLLFDEVSPDRVPER